MIGVMPENFFEGGRGIEKLPYTGDGAALRSVSAAFSAERWGDVEG